MASLPLAGLFKQLILTCSGHVAGPHWNESGSGSNFLCLHENPQWRRYFSGHQYSGSIYGAEYIVFHSGGSNNVFSTRNNGGDPLINKPTPCAACYVGGRSTILMVPARTQCPDGWTMEYGGYLVSESNRDKDRERSSYICWDEAPEVAAGRRSADQSVIYPVEVQCGTLPCSTFISGRELACVVCSK